MRAPQPFPCTRLMDAAGLDKSPVRCAGFAELVAKRPLCLAGDWMPAARPIVSLFAFQVNRRGSKNTRWKRRHMVLSRDRHFHGGKQRARDNTLTCPRSPQPHRQRKKGCCSAKVRPAWLVPRGERRWRYRDSGFVKAGAGCSGRSASVPSWQPRRATKCVEQVGDVNPRGEGH